MVVLLILLGSFFLHLFFWKVDNWEKIKSVTLPLPAGKSPQGDTRVQFHSDQVRLLVCHETQLAIYDASKMECIRQWMPQEVLSSSISCAVYSCNSQLVYATFTDGNIGAFDADSLRLRCRIAPSAYISSASSNSQTVHPVVVVAHQQEANQKVVGLTNGAVKVIELSEPERKGVPVDNGTENVRTATSATTNTSENLQR
ncbi:topless-related protein 2-like [Hibiscus syriacus]|uniref:topless-related protein 2-like n=1 Tax=Hibiscus syriacus TaxID=106335 RepID=UPI00192376F5|nr:topless-related protein 2-like [Hibiscus syriacus]